jgi:hypothetical protein
LTFPSDLAAQAFLTSLGSCKNNARLDHAAAVAAFHVTHSTLLPIVGSYALVPQGDVLFSAARSADVPAEPGRALGMVRGG